MTESEQRAKDQAPRLSNAIRTLSAFSGLCCLALVTIAANLEPDPSGIGTHQQLGLPPCSSIALFGIRCPACGMTTSWALAANLEIMPSLRTNIAGFLLFSIALAFIPISCYFTIVGKGTQRQWFSFSFGIMLLTVLGIAVGQWAIAGITSN